MGLTLTLAYVADHGGPVVDEEAPVPPAHLGRGGRGHGAHQAHVLTLRENVKLSQIKGQRILISYSDNFCRFIAFLSLISAIFTHHKPGLITSPEALHVIYRLCLVTCIISW